MNDTDLDTVKSKEIYDRYHKRYDGETQGLCAVIARDIAMSIGGEVVAGYIDYRSGTRTHWWVEKNGEIHDPMTDRYFYPDEYKHVEVHRNIDEFNKVLQRVDHYSIK